MREVRRELRARTRDLLGYVRMLRFIEQTSGAVLVRSTHGNPASMPLTPETIHVLKAGVFLHLYNLVESTVTAGLVAITEQIRVDAVRFADLTDSWQRAWAGNHSLESGPEHRIQVVLKMCSDVAEGRTIEVKPKISGGNLDDRRIEDIAKTYGISLTFGPSVKKAVKYEVHNDQGFLGLIRLRRNGLAHGEESFAEIGRDYPVADLVRWSWSTYQYLKEVLASFEAYLRSQKFRRPGAP